MLLRTKFVGLVQGAIESPADPAPKSRPDTATQETVVAQDDSLFQIAAGQARRAFWLGASVIVVTVVVLTLWIVTAPIEAAIIGSGHVEVVDHRTTVQHQEGGIVASVHVHEGDQVKVGQVLIEIVDKSVESELAVVQSGLDAVRIRKSRLMAERALSRTPDFPEDLLHDGKPAVAAMIAAERESFQTNRAMLDIQLKLVDAQQSDARAEIAGLRREITQIQNAYDLLKNEIANAKRLVSQNYMTRNALSNLQREAADYRAQLENRRTQISRARKKIASLSVQKQEIRSNYVNQASQSLSDLEKEERRLFEQRRPLEDAVTRQSIRARVAGTVLAMEPLHPGSVLPPGGRILDIVPDEDQLVINARVAVGDIDEVSAGQIADIRFTAFPARRTPIVLGRVEHVSADRLYDKSTHQSYYEVEVSVDKESLKHARLPQLHPGMSATVFLRTHRRTMLDYILNPIIIFHEKSMRET